MYMCVYMNVWFLENKVDRRADKHFTAHTFVSECIKLDFAEAVLQLGSGRALAVAVDDSPLSAKALQWMLDNVYRSGRLSPRNILAALNAAQALLSSELTVSLAMA